MSEDSNVTLLDTSPGGENTQYESINTSNNTYAKEEGQFGYSTNTDALTKDKLEQSEKEDHKAENLRYGEAMSEHGFGGETMGSSGYAQQQGYGRTDEKKGAGNISHAREEQHYEKGSNIGA